MWIDLDGFFGESRRLANFLSSESAELFLFAGLLLCCYGGYKSQGDPNFQAEGFFGGRQLSFYGSARMQVDRAAVRCGW